MPYFSARMAEPVVSIRNLSKVYQQGDIQVTALNGVSLDIGAGEFLALMGPWERALQLAELPASPR